jgi:hypothetical protein
MARTFATRRAVPALLLTALACLPLLAPAAATLPRAAGGPATPPLEKGQRVFVCGHSFHVFIAAPLAGMARAAGLKDHTTVGTQFLGGSRTLQHWNLPDEKNKAKQALQTGAVDVLTLAPIQHPDEGVDHFVALALKHNPAVRVTVQASWAAWDSDNTQFPKGARAKVDRDKTPEQLRQIHAAYFKSVEEQVAALNQRHGKPVVFLVPCGQAVVALRSKIHAGKVPGLKAQEELFGDPIGHARPPLQALVAYCHYAVIYRRSPVGLPLPDVLRKASNPAWDDSLNRALQEIAWEAVTSHPLSGVKAGK